MTFYTENKYFRYAFLTLFISISLIFFLLNHSLFKQKKKIERFNEFKIEAKNINSIFVNKFRNQHLKKNLRIKKGQSLNTVLSNANVLQKDISDITKLLAKYLNLKKNK